MSLKKLNRISHSLSFRLTFWYAAIFIISSCVAFLLFYILITSVISQRLDDDLLEKIGTYSNILTIEGVNAVERMAILDAQAAGEKKIFIRLMSSNGEVFSSSNMSYWKDIDVSEKAIQSLIKGSPYIFETIVLPEKNDRVRILYGIIGKRIILQLGQSMENYSRFIEAFNKIFVVTMFFLFILAVLIGWFMARQALAGVGVITHTARQISDGSLDKRVPVKTRGDEIDLLAVTFNQMLDRIQMLLRGIKEMSDNIAHDLKGPVTRIRGIAEVNLTTETSLDEYGNMTASIIEECDRLLDMINTMLMISKTEAGVREFIFDKVDLSSIVRDACELFQPIAEDKGVIMTYNVPTKSGLTGDMRMLQRMIANLLDNAIKYTPSGGEVHVSVRENDEEAHISIRDSGIGVSETDLPHIFERFYRCDPSRTETGTGLGLSLAQAIAHAHKGSITVWSSPGRGSTFTIVLPKSQIS